jgi:hypothetical protein
MLKNELTCPVSNLNGLTSSSFVGASTVMVAGIWPDECAQQIDHKTEATAQK